MKQRIAIIITGSYCDTDLCDWRLSQQLYEPPPDQLHLDT